MIQTVLSSGMHVQRMDSGTPVCRSLRPKKSCPSKRCSLQDNDSRHCTLAIARSLRGQEVYTTKHKLRIAVSILLWLKNSLNAKTTKSSRSKTMIQARRNIAGYILDAFSNARVYSMCCKRPSWIYKNKPPGLGERLEQHLIDGRNIPLLGSGFYAKQSCMCSDIALGG